MWSKSCSTRPVSSCPPGTFGLVLESSPDPRSLLPRSAYGGFLRGRFKSLGDAGIVKALDGGNFCNRCDVECLDGPLGFTRARGFALSLRNRLADSNDDSRRFRRSSDGTKVFYVESSSRDHRRLQGVFAAEWTQDTDKNGKILGSHYGIVRAESGEETVDPRTGERFLVVRKGTRVDGTPGLKNYRITEFERYGLKIHPPLVQPTPRERALPTSVLWRQRSSGHPEILAELTWRFSMPVLWMIVTVLAVPLAQLSLARPLCASYSGFFAVCFSHEHTDFISCVDAKRLTPVGLARGFVAWFGFVVSVLYWRVQEYGWPSWRFR